MFRGPGALSIVQEFLVRQSDCSKSQLLNSSREQAEDGLSHFWKPGLVGKAVSQIGPAPDVQRKQGLSTVGITQTWLRSPAKTFFVSYTRGISAPSTTANFPGLGWQKGGFAEGCLVLWIYQWWIVIKKQKAKTQVKSKQKAKPAIPTATENTTDST